MVLHTIMPPRFPKEIQDIKTASDQLRTAIRRLDDSSPDATFNNTELKTVVDQLNEAEDRAVKIAWKKQRQAS